MKHVPATRSGTGEGEGHFADSAVLRGKILDDVNGARKARVPGRGERSRLSISRLRVRHLRHLRCHRRCRRRLHNAQPLLGALARAGGAD